MGDEGIPPSPAMDQKGTRPTHFAAELAPPHPLRFRYGQRKLLSARPARNPDAEPAIRYLKAVSRTGEQSVNFIPVRLHDERAAGRGHRCRVARKNVGRVSQ